LGILVFKAIIWQLALKRLPLSIAYPLTSFDYIAILLISYFFFNETVTVSNVAGCIVIVVGIMLLLRSGKASSHA
jgi:multidrug transporter EmrE-like cation transporter